MSPLPGPRAASLAALALTSLSITLFGFYKLTHFDQTAGTTAAAPPVWPLTTKVRRPAKRPELLVFVHPFCSCTMATLSELARIAAKAGKLPKAAEITLLFAAGSRSELENNSLWRQASRLPGARAVWDREGREARLFGALTSGYALLYSPAGKLLFHGGVTGSRGHEGENFGSESLLRAMVSGHSESTTSLVFGCALFGKDSAR